MTAKARKRVPTAPAMSPVWLLVAENGQAWGPVFWRKEEAETYPRKGELDRIVEYRSTEERT